MNKVDLIPSCRRTQVLLTTPTTPQQRMQAIAEATQGFLYLVSCCYAGLPATSTVVSMDTLWRQGACDVPPLLQTVAPCRHGGKLPQSGSCMTLHGTALPGSSCGRC